MAKRANPQGKGLVPVLQNLRHDTWQRVVRPKQLAQIELELFTSLFVLQSEVKFNPRPGQCYHLYETSAGYKLLLVAPWEWHKPYPGRYIGACTLQQDRTWTLELDPAMVEDTTFMARIAAQQQRLQQRLEQAATLEDAMPAGAENPGYHNRVLAFLLGKSLRFSMQLAGIHSLGYAEAKGALAAPHSEN